VGVRGACGVCVVGEVCVYAVGGKRLSACVCGRSLRVAEEVVRMYACGCGCV
jgi:hypothetical protein